MGDHRFPFPINRLSPRLRNLTDTSGTLANSSLRGLPQYEKTDYLTATVSRQVTSIHAPGGRKPHHKVTQYLTVSGQATSLSGDWLPHRKVTEYLTVSGQATSISGDWLPQHKVTEYLKVC